ncbi:DUF2922 domain-containing protein [Thermosediminibacter litoriperuensis]|uniref:DUF2922 family protein n=1 Tax=Thermosediminibacter litoriperuensis TaxID=291989 RepID=A0A5S5AQ76_9FIRM|nr:DUF2922 domain-containing protein [Thermosediminibacter litoriperuensis]TYP53799.1 Protein of unknown function (DUF2922) [Thermosediminibacter litoriperuensis]
MAQILEMSFQNEAGRTTRILVPDPNENLTPQEIQPVMDLVVSRNLFATSGGDIVKALGARVLIRDAVEIIPRE